MIAKVKEFVKRRWKLLLLIAAMIIAVIFIKTRKSR